MPNATGPATPRNMGTQQCENIDVENQNTVGTDLGVHTSDPLLKVVEWIAHLTKVSYFHVKDVIVTSFFSQIGSIVIAVVYIVRFFLFYLPHLPWFFVTAHGVEALVNIVILSLAGGVIGWCYLHFLWVRPSRHLLLGIQQVSTSQAFLKKSFQNNRSNCDHSVH